MGGKSMLEVYQVKSIGRFEVPHLNGVSFISQRTYI